MPAPAVFVAGSMSATDPVSVSSQTAFPSVARDCVVGAATVAVGTMGVAANGEGDAEKGVGLDDGVARGDGIAVGEGVGLGDGVRLGAGAMPKPTPSIPNARIVTSRPAIATIARRA